MQKPTPPFLQQLFDPYRSINYYFPLFTHPSSHDNARNRDAAALVAVALDALGLAGQATMAASSLGGLEDALDCGDGGGCGTVGHFA